MSDFYNNSIFWVEVDRISPNPYQPRKEFNDDKIAELADSIRQYGVLQPLVVTRQETERADGGISVEYELIAGERRLRASKIAGVPQVPVIIRAQEQSNKMKLELAIIENLQREDLNAIDRAMAFKQLVDEFNLKHIEIAKKVGKSREYVSNTLRLLGLPEYIQGAVSGGLITEGHARPLLMLGEERAAERDTLFKEITTKKLTVRESERIARRIATDKARKQDLPPELVQIEKGLTETLGTRVQIEKRSKSGGKVHIDFFSEEDLQRILDMLAKHESGTREGTTVPTALTADEALKKFNDTFAQQKDIVDEEAAVTSEVAEDVETNNNTESHSYEQLEAAQEPENPFAIVPPTPTESAPTSTQHKQDAIPDNIESMPETKQPAASWPAEPENPFAQVPSQDVPTAPETHPAPKPDDIYSIRNFSI